MIAETQPPPWTGVLPGHVAARVLRRAPEAQAGVRRRLDAVVLALDVDGFTAASERLAGEGAAGTERMRDALNEAFGTMLATVARHGGHVLQFRGDALTALFPTGAGSHAGAARRGAACALALAGPHATGGGVPLSVRAALAHGPVRSVVAGDPAQRLLVVTTGTVLRRCAAGEGHAPHGAVVADAALADVPGLELGRAVGGGFRHVAAVRAVRARASRAAHDAPADAARAAVFLPPVVADRLAAGRRALVDEHRPVTVVVIGGLADDRPAAATAAGVAEIVRIALGLGGHVLQADVDGRGLRCLVVFGAPIGREDDAARAVACAAELAALHPEGGLGIASGTAFCGLVGGPIRLDYTVLGDVVNVAARLAARAGPGRGLVAETTAAQAGDAAAFGPLRRLRLRGRRAIVPVRRLRSGTGSTGRRTPSAVPPARLVGRARELRRLRRALQGTAAGRGRAVVLSGPPGIGKSRLLRELTEQARAAGFLTCTGRAPIVAPDAPYRVLREPVLALLGLDGSLPPATTLAQADERLRAVDERLPLQLPLLAVLLDLPRTVAPPTDALEAEAQTAALHSLLGALVRAACQRGPVLLAIDDAHGSDAASLPLLGALARDAASLPLLLAFAVRPDEGVDPLADAGPDLRAVRVAVEPLPRPAVERLLALRGGQLWGRGAVPASVRERVCDRAAGNPLYAEELLRDARERTEGDATPAKDPRAELPDRLQRLILARVDRLAERERAALVAASVMGGEFTGAALAAVDPSLGRPREAQAALDALQRVELTEADAIGAHTFRQPAVREAVYDSLSRATRAGLHEAVGAHLERAGPGASVELLAHHYGASRRVDKQREYWRLAAEAARRRYAHDAACAHYRRLLDVAPADELAGVQRALGEVLTIGGDWPAAERHLQDALDAAAAQGDGREAAAAELGLGTVSFFTRSFEEARGRLERARTALASVPDAELLGRTLQQLGITRFQLGDYEGARAAAEEQLALAREHGDRVGASAAHETIGLVRWYGGDTAGALTELRRSLRVARSAGHLVGVVHASGDLAGVHAERGEYARSAAGLAEAFEVAERIGYRHALGVIAGNAGELCLGWGDVDGARRRYHQALGLAVELGDVAGVQAATAGLGSVAVAGGRLREGAALLTRATALARAIEQPYAEAAALLGLADVRRRQGRPGAARRRAREALAAAEAGGNDDVAFAAGLLGTTLAGARDAAARRSALRELDARLASEPELADEQRAGLLHAVWQLDPGRSAARRAAAALYSRLHRRTPLARYRERHLELTGRSLATPAFPEVPTGPEAEQRLGSLLARARAIELRTAAAARPGAAAGDIHATIERATS
jgi:class 3 adenylate cyclase/tetratricopeptide (TPR) repeat protein